MYVHFKESVSVEARFMQNANDEVRELESKLSSAQTELAAKKDEIYLLKQQHEQEIHHDERRRKAVETDIQTARSEVCCFLVGTVERLALIHSF